MSVTFLDELQPIVPLVIALLAAFLGYIFGQRKKKLDRFYSQVQDNLKDACSPMFHEIRLIQRTESSIKREALLEKFFEKYRAETTNIYKIGDTSILKLFYEVEDFYNSFVKQHSKESWEKFWYKFHLFCIMVQNEYWDNFSVVYGEYRWRRFIWKKNYLLRIVNEIIGILYETTLFLVIVNLLVIYFIIFDYLTAQKFFPIQLLKYALLSATVSLSFWGLMLVLGSHYLALTRHGTGIIRTLFEKRFPRLFRSWDKWLSNQPECVRKK